MGATRVVICSKFPTFVVESTTLEILKDYTELL